MVKMRSFVGSLRTELFQSAFIFNSGLNDNVGYNQANMLAGESNMSVEIIAVIAFNNINPFHLSVPYVVFRSYPEISGLPDYEIKVCAVESLPLRTSAGFSISTEYDLGALEQAQVIIIPSWRDAAEMPPLALLDALVAARRRGAKIVGLCLGAFVLAAAGLLDGRKATTHWRWAGELARRYPRAQVDPDVLYIDECDIVTSAGSAAAIDCCLHLLRSRCGADIANQVARRLVVPPHRQGGQAQYIEQPVFSSVIPDRLALTLEWMTQNLNQTQSLDDLAQHALMSRRTFTRRFRQVTGTTVGSWLLSQRLAMAQRLLETTDKSIDAIAEAAGFGTAVLFRRSFIKAFSIKPSTYRREFQGVKQ
jgi:transcriptional regulator GlxA family with amidase domain